MAHLDDSDGGCGSHKVSYKTIQNQGSLVVARTV